MEFHVTKTKEGYELQFIKGDTVNRKYTVNDEYDVGELVTNLMLTFEK